jgi:hypothetical protein
MVRLVMHCSGSLRSEGLQPSLEPTLLQPPPGPKTTHPFLDSPHVVSWQHGNLKVQPPCPNTGQL